MSENNEKDKDMQKEDLNFEEAVKKLENIVGELESGGLNLNDSLEKFTEGVELIKFCNKELDRAEEKIEKVIKEDDEYKEVVPFNFREE